MTTNPERRLIFLQQLRLPFWTILLALFAAINVFGVNRLLDRLPWDGRHETALWHVRKRLLRNKQGEDSWYPMTQAFQYLRQPGDDPLYQEIFFQRRIKFQYPPSALLVLYPCLWLNPAPLQQGLQGGDPLSVYRPWFRQLRLVSLLFFYGGCGFTLLIFFTALAQIDPDPAGRSPAARLLCATAVLLLAATYYPAVKAFSLGQIQVWLLALFAAAVWAWLSRREKTAALLLALIALIKPHYAVLGVWLLLRRRRPAAWTFWLTLALGLSLAIACFGWRNHLDYLRVLQFIARHGESFYPNQSVNGLLNRLLHNGNNTEWVGTTFPPEHPLVYWGTLLSAPALLGLALWPRRRKSAEVGGTAPSAVGTAGSPFQSGGCADLLLAALAVTLAAPVVWEHHYGILLPVCACLLPWLLAERKRRHAQFWSLAICYSCSSQLIIAANSLAQTPFNFLQSYLFFSGLGMLALLVRILHAHDREAVVGHN